MIGLSTSCNVDLDTEMVECASLASAFRSYRPGKSGGTISIERLFDAGGGMPMMYLQMQRTSLKYAVEVDGLTISGNAYISSQSAAAPVSGYATHRVTLTCTGEIVVDAGYINFVDTAVMRICLGNWGDGIGMNAAMAGDVKTIGTVFYNNKTIAKFDELALFTGLERLESYAFCGCTSLTSVVMPDSIKKVGGRVFEGDRALASVTLSAGLTGIANYMFKGCESLASLAIPSGVASVGTEAFYGCFVLQEIDLPSGVTNIGNKAFYSNSPLKLTVRATVPPTLGTEAFYNGGSGVEIYVPSGSVGAYKRATNWSAYASKIKAI